MRCLAMSSTLCMALAVPLVGAATMNRAVAPSQDSHTLSKSYKFDPRDGWETVSVMSQRYAHRSPQTSSRSPESALNSTSAAKRSANTSQKQSDTRSALKSVAGTLAHFFDGLVGLGKSEPVTITWYTGQDLLNPSCWTHVNWAPTDQSFVAAVTKDGWKTRPKCFEFLELCNQHHDCTFVRVVDTCAGCVKGSKHVDLTQAAFEHLGSLDQGVMTVQMRGANRPENWSDDLWGPKVN